MAKASPWPPSLGYSGWIWKAKEVEKEETVCVVEFLKGIGDVWKAWPFNRVVSLVNWRTPLLWIVAESVRVMLVVGLLKPV